SVLPSKNSKEAPPPVEMWLKPSSSRPKVRTDAAESPPPTTVKEPLLAGAEMMAWATPAVRLEKASISNTPMGPCQNTVLETARTFANASTELAPLSKDMQPSGMRLSSTTLWAASAAHSDAAMRSTGSTSLSPKRPNKDLQLLIWSSCSRDFCTL